jgi:cap2 methyltransferase
MPIESFRILRPDHPRQAYLPSSTAFEDLASAPRKGLHFGQRKLLLSEIELLSSLIADQDATAASSSPLTASAESSEVEDKKIRPLLVVYAGAANGSHLPLLFDLFPAVRFVLIDPAPFCAAVQAISQLKGGPVLELISGYCTDELCLRLRRQYGQVHRLVLVSDIRSGVPEKMSNKENTEMICRDNAMQASWCVSLAAEAAMLKFHPPYPAVTDKASRRYDPADDTPATVTYLDGTLLFGVWAPKSSSEVRLLVLGGGFTAQRSYNCLEFEEQLYHYNVSDRYAKDVQAERSILSAYISATANSAKGLHKTAESLSRGISAFLGYPLFTPLADGFGEDDARLAALLYSTRNDDDIALFPQVRQGLTIRRLIELVERRYGLRVGGGGNDCWAEDAQGGAETDCMSVNGVQLPEDFWTRIATPKHLTEVYSLPMLRQPARFVRAKNPRR